MSLGIEKDKCKSFLEKSKTRMIYFPFTTEWLTQAPKMMLLIGMKTSLIIYPINPITKKPMAHAYKIFKYSTNIINYCFHKMGGGLTILVWLGTFIEKVAAVFHEVLHLLDGVLVLFFIGF